MPDSPLSPKKNLKKLNTEQALRESEERFELAVEGSSVGLWDWNVRTDDLYWSRRFKEIIGITSEDFVPHFDEFKDRLHPDDIEPVLKQLNDHLRNRKPYDIEYRLLRQDGEYIWIRARGQAIWDEKGAPTRMAGSVDDITARKVAEENLKANNRQLRNLSAKIQTIQEEERRRIAREIHDQFGQLLTSFQIDLYWLSDHIPQELTPVHVVNKRLQADCNEMIRKVREIATLLRPAILDDLGLNAAMEWQAEDYQKRNDVPCEFVSSLSDERLDTQQSSALFRICQEALTNITRHAEASYVSIRLITEETNVVMEVTDDGKGLPAEAIHDTHTLGLLGIRERAAACHGSVEFISAPDKGTTVKVVMPIERE